MAVSDRELDRHSCWVAAPALGAAGDLVAGIELRVRNLAQDVPVVKAPLTVAASWLSRELSTAGAGASGRTLPETWWPESAPAERRNRSPARIPLDAPVDSDGELALG
jgi:hypothetical protein